MCSTFVLGYRLGSRMCSIYISGYCICSIRKAYVIFLWYGYGSLNNIC